MTTNKKTTCSIRETQALIKDSRFVRIKAKLAEGRDLDINDTRDINNLKKEYPRSEATINDVLIYEPEVKEIEN